MLQVKCSDNDLYRVNPVFTFLEPYETLKFDVVRREGQPKVDKLVFVSASADKDAKKPEDLFVVEPVGRAAVLPLLKTESFDHLAMKNITQNENTAINVGSS
ncbi:hypothetical protein AB6A40_007571 [Gnathostoma spinigerum]|uniref:MSP domain-containing protein n=1 Tax=Gnathostoma spinigerum TaxID=75299 RepID=A0ABD6ENT2_9BILA